MDSVDADRARRAAATRARTRRIVPAVPRPCRAAHRSRLRRMRVDLFDFELPPDGSRLRPARPRDRARLLAVAGGHFRSCRARPAAAAPSRRCAGVQRHPGHPGAARGQARRGADRRDPAQARGAARLARVRPQRQARCGRRQDRLRRGRRGVGDRATASDGVVPAAASRARSRSNCCSSAPGGCRCRPISPRKRAGRRGATATIIRRCSRARKARSRRRPPRFISRRG